MASTNQGKIRIRRGTTANWANDYLYEGQPGIETRSDGTVRLKVGPTPQSGQTTTPWANCKDIAPDQSIYTNTEIVNTNGHTVSDSPLNTACLRNVICMSANSSDPSASSYEEGTVLIKYTP